MQKDKNFNAKCTAIDAANGAQNKYRGKVIEVELEDEHGYLVYRVEELREVTPSWILV